MADNGGTSSENGRSVSGNGRLFARRAAERFQRLVAKLCEIMEDLSHRHGFREWQHFDRIWNLCQREADMHKGNGFNMCWHNLCTMVFCKLMAANRLCLALDAKSLTSSYACKWNTWPMLHQVAMPTKSGCCCGIGGRLTSSPLCGHRSLR